MNAVNIKITNLHPNTGQIPGVPANPRFIKDESYEKLKQSIIDDPEMLDLRELLVYPHPDKTGHFIIIGGNMRYRACKEIGFKKVPCKIIPEEATPEKLKAILIKDNSNFGNWDMDMLANEWNDKELNDWGVDLLNFLDENDPSVYGDSFSLKDGDREKFQNVTFTFADEQLTIIQNAISEIKKTDEYKYCETMGNENSNGNALYLIVVQWAEQRK